MRRLISELSVIGKQRSFPKKRPSHSLLGPSSGGQILMAASSPAELAECIPFTSLALPEYTLSLAYEADHVFTNLLFVSEHQQEMPVVVKLGHDCLQIASVSPTRNFTLV